MNADLIAMLGGAGPSSASTSRRETEGKTILSFKAGKMNTTLQPNGKYLITPDPRRGTVALTWHATSSSSSSSNTNANNNGGLLKFEWTDRRTRTTVDSLTIFPGDNVTFTNITTGRPKDRVYLLQYGSNTDQMFFYWMQDKEEGNEDEDNCVKVNVYSADPNEAKSAANGGVLPTDAGAAEAAGGGEGGEDAGGPASSAASASRAAVTARRTGGLDMTGLGGGGLDNAALMQILGGLNARDTPNAQNASDTTATAAAGGTGSGGGGGGAQGQVDALSNILENLGMPQPIGSAPMTPGAALAPTASTTSATPATAKASNTTTTPAAPARSTTNTGKGLTLSDLQGAMATLATTSPPSSTGMAQPGPPLEQIITPETVLSSGLLDNPEVKARLIQFLPEDQRSEERLMENLRSPQVVQCLKSLTGAICDDGDALGSILANFQLSPEDGAAAMNRGNPIQAFLDCVLKSVEREKEQDGGAEGNGENNDGDAEMSG